MYYWIVVCDCKQLSREALATWIVVCDCKQLSREALATWIVVCDCKQLSREALATFKQLYRYRYCEHKFDKIRSTWLPHSHPLVWTMIPTTFRWESCGTNFVKFVLTITIAVQLFNGRLWHDVSNIYVTIYTLCRPFKMHRLYSRGICLLRIAYFISTYLITTPVMLRFIWRLFVT
jgi:hypothetical protein